MPIPLPNLDDLDWNELTREGRLLIPGVAPDWTNHNASDPGITLLELFAYFTEILHYRVNRIGDANLREFVRLLRGPTWKPGPDLTLDIRDTVAGLCTIHRAVTAADYEQLALTANVAFHSPEGECVSRVRCIPDCNLDIQAPNAPLEDAPGHVSLVVVSNRHALPSRGLLRAVRHTLEPARLLTTRVHVTGPSLVVVSAQIHLVPRTNVLFHEVQSAALTALREFFDPLRGGVQGEGWPFGRDVYVSELYQLLSKLPGVDYILRIRDAESGEELDELVTGAAEKRLQRNDTGELESVALEPHELAAIDIEHCRIVVGAA